MQQSSPLLISDEQLCRRKEICAAYGTGACDTSNTFSPFQNKLHHQLRMIITGTVATAAAIASWVLPWRSPFKYLGGVASAGGVFMVWHSNVLSTMSPDEHHIVTLPLGASLDVWADNFERIPFWQRTLHECKTTKELSTSHIELRTSSK
jgi:hypothetical protein